MNYVTDDRGYRVPAVGMEGSDARYKCQYPVLIEHLSKIVHTMTPADMDAIFAIAWQENEQAKNFTHQMSNQNTRAIDALASYFKGGKS